MKEQSQIKPSFPVDERCISGMESWRKVWLMLTKLASLEKAEGNVDGLGLGAQGS